MKNLTVSRRLEDDISANAKSHSVSLALIILTPLTYIATSALPMESAPENSGCYINCSYMTLCMNEGWLSYRCDNSGNLLANTRIATCDTYCSCQCSEPCGKDCGF